MYKFKKALMRALLCCVGAFLLLQLYFFSQVVLMRFVDPQSSSFQRSELLRLVLSPKPLRWSQHWVPLEKISNQLKKAVIVSEDDLFASHDGVQWGAIARAWKKNQSTGAGKNVSLVTVPNATSSAKIVGGSTITQQLAKNLFLSSERTFVRKAQEFMITVYLELLLPKKRILEIYLNSVEWGEGVFGAEAAARHYFSTSAQSLSSAQAARLAVMLPRPKYFEKLPASPYLASRAELIEQRMQGAVLP
jgi:monofunctional biosynthetic peptidoglycan transglycosylase